MHDHEETLNTESNDIAGNRIDGPIGNTAAKPGAPGTGVGVPGGPPAPQGGSGKDREAGGTAASEPSAPEASAAASAPGTESGQQIDQASTPANRDTPAAYGGNFSNSTQGSYQDEDRRSNQESSPTRGEFGAQDLEGTTHGGFGNQNRQADYTPSGSAEDQYYGGAGGAGPQDNAYRAYDGRDERADPRHSYGFEPGTPQANTSGQAADAAPSRPGMPSGPAMDNTNQPDRADALSAHQNDNGSPVGPDRGFAADYGQTSLHDAAAPAPSGQESAEAPRRNQGEDGQSSRGGYDNQGKTGGTEGHRQEAEAVLPAGVPTGEGRGQRPDSSLGYGDRGRDAPHQMPDYQTGSDRSGYVTTEGGDAAQGVGSRGGSYNDTYDDSRPGSREGSPAKGDQRREDLDANYGDRAREDNRTGDDNASDHGAPRRNAGRDGEADE